MLWPCLGLAGAIGMMNGKAIHPPPTSPHPMAAPQRRKNMVIGTDQSAYRIHWRRVKPVVIYQMENKLPMDRISSTNCSWSANLPRAPPKQGRLFALRVAEAAHVEPSDVTKPLTPEL